MSQLKSHRSSSVGSAVSSVMTSSAIDLSSVKLSLRSDLHLGRKAFHLFLGLLMAFIYLYGMDRGVAVVTLSCVLGFDLLLETLRLKIPSLNLRLMKVMGPVMRASEANRLSGVPYYVAAATLAIAIFPKPIAVLSILFLACGDPIASLFGILYGNKSIRFKNGKSLIGTMAGVVICWITAFIFLKSLGATPAQVFWMSFIGGIAGGTAELLPVDIDDNFIIPVVSGFVLWAVWIVLGF